MPVRFLHYSDIENALDNPERVGRFVSLLRRERDESTLVCGTGDVLGPSLLAMETDGEHVLPFFEAVDPDYATVGNHDFDLGLDVLRSAIERAPHQWLVANLRDADGRPFAADRGVGAACTTTVDGTTVGLVGVTDPETIGDHVRADLTVTDPVAAVREAVADRRDAVDLLVVLSHAGQADDDIARVDGVDLVLGGHDHELRADTVAGTPVVHPGERGEALSAVTVTDGEVAVRLHDVTEAPVESTVAGTYRGLFEEFDLARPVAQAATPVGRARADRYPESALGNLVTDAYRWVAGADVAVVHPFMLRLGPPLSGTLTNGDLRAVAPFDNEIHTTTLSGDDLRAVFEGFSTTSVDIGLDREVFGHVSGADLAWRRTEDALELVSATVDGDPLAAGDDHVVAAPTFEFQSDLYPPLAAPEETHGHQHDALVAYARERDVDPAPAGRMTLTDDSVGGDFRSLG